MEHEGFLVARLGPRLRRDIRCLGSRVSGHAVPLKAAPCAFSSLPSAASSKDRSGTSPRRITSAPKRPDARSACAASKSSKSVKAARKTSSGGASRNRSRWPMIPDGAIVVVLDQRGESLDSTAFAGLLREWRAEDLGGRMLYRRRRRRTGAEPDRARRNPAGFRQGDVAASAGAGHAPGAALPCRHSHRTSLSSGVIGHNCSQILPHCFVTVQPGLRLNPGELWLLRLAFLRLAPTLGQHDSPTLEPAPTPLGLARRWCLRCRLAAILPLLRKMCQPNACRRGAIPGEPNPREPNPCDPNPREPSPERSPDLSSIKSGSIAGVRGTGRRRYPQAARPGTRRAPRQGACIGGKPSEAPARN